MTTDRDQLREALRQARDYLLEVGNDYPGSSCQKWCTEKAREVWNAVNPWRHCPSTHCERTQECRSVNECAANKRAILATPDPEQIADTPGTGLISEDLALRELGLLYNYREDDSQQFTRWQMIVAMSHGAALTRTDALAEAHKLLRRADSLIDRVRRGGHWIGPSWGDETDLWRAEVLSRLNAQGGKP